MQHGLRYLVGIRFLIQRPAWRWRLRMLQVRCVAAAHSYGSSRKLVGENSRRKIDLISLDFRPLGPLSFVDCQLSISGARLDLAGEWEVLCLQPMTQAVQGARLPSQPSLPADPAYANRMLQPPVP